MSHGIDYHFLFYKDLSQILGEKLKKRLPLDEVTVFDIFDTVKTRLI